MYSAKIKTIQISGTKNKKTNANKSHRVLAFRRKTAGSQRSLLFHIYFTYFEFKQINKYIKDSVPGDLLWRMCIKLICIFCFVWHFGWCIPRRLCSLTMTLCIDFRIAHSTLSSVRFCVFLVFVFIVCLFSFFSTMPPMRFVFQHFFFSFLSFGSLLS